MILKIYKNWSGGYTIDFVCMFSNNNIEEYFNFFDVFEKDKNIYCIFKNAKRERLENKIKSV